MLQVKEKHGEILGRQIKMIFPDLRFVLRENFSNLGAKSQCDAAAKHENQEPQSEDARLKHHAP